MKNPRQIPKAWVLAGSGLTGLAVIAGFWPRNPVPVPLRETRTEPRAPVTGEALPAVGHTTATTSVEPAETRQISTTAREFPTIKESSAHRHSERQGASVEVVDKPSQPAEEMSVEIVSRPTGPMVWKTPLVYRIDEFSFRENHPGIPLEVLDSVRQKFEKDVGAGEIPPTDPEYAERWTHAEPSALERMRTLFGWAAVAEFERKAVMESLAADSGSGKN